ncbi:MAG: signal peptidase II [Clostridia bacterium]|nr:signal peptidase II [Clostridia bacterium]
MLIWAISAALVVIFDQVAKILVMHNIGPTDCFHIIPGLFDFVYVKNTGAAFSILSNNTGLLSIVSIVFCVGVLWYWYKTKPASTLLKLSLCLLFAGALGNAIDRIFRGFVVDFISTAFMEFPVFNIADIAITFGAALLIIYFIFFDKEDENGESVG